MYEADDLAKITGVSEKRADDWINKAKKKPVDFTETYVDSEEWAEQNCQEAQ